MDFKEQELQEIHSFLIEALSKRHSSVVDKLWFVELKLSALTKDEAIFVASTDMKKDIIEDKFSDDLSECLAEIEHSLSIRLHRVAIKHMVAYIYAFGRKCYIVAVGCRTHGKQESSS